MQRSEMLISELRQALKAITDQDVANTRASAEIEVLLRKELLETKNRLAELEPAWDMFIAKHNEEEEAQGSEQRRRASVVAQPSERRHRRLENEANRVELRVVTSMPPSDAAATTSRLATPPARTLTCWARVPPNRHRPSESSNRFLSVFGSTTLRIRART